MLLAIHYIAAFKKWNWYFEKRSFKSTQNAICFELTLLLHLMQKEREFLGRQATYAFLQMPNNSSEESFHFPVQITPGGRNY